MFRRSTALLAVAAAFGTSAGAQVFNGGIPSGYTCTALDPSLGCGTSGAAGSITAAPGGGSQFGWVSTNGGSARNPLNISGTTNGSTLTSGLFTSTAGQSLSFAFNYITSDGTGNFTDYAFVRLLSTTGAPPIILFTARTTPSGDVVPGFGLPGLAPGVTLTPSTTPIIPGPVDFAPLGVDSNNRCFSSPTAGCGFTNWVIANYVVETSDTYQLEFNVFNMNDRNFQSALAFDFSTGAGGTPVVPPTNVVPEPSTYVLLATGLLGVVGIARRRRTV